MMEEADEMEVEEGFGSASEETEGGRTVWVLLFLLRFPFGALFLGGYGEKEPRYDAHDVGDGI